MSEGLNADAAMSLTVKNEVRRVCQILRGLLIYTEGERVGAVCRAILKICSHGARARKSIDFYIVFGV